MISHSAAEMGLERSFDQALAQQGLLKGEPPTDVRRAG